VLIAALVAPVVAAAQEPGARSPEPGPPAAGSGLRAPGSGPKTDFITPHIRDSRELAIPWPGRGLEKEIHLPRWAPIRVLGLEIDLSPTKHVVMLWIAAALCVLVLVSAARGVQRRQREGRPPSGLANAVEAVVLYLRNEVILPNVGHHGEQFVPFCLTAFFMILFANLLGLVPYGATATGNISVTATLAALSFIMIEVSGMRALGKGYLNTIVYWPRDLPLAVKAPITLIMTPVEILSKLTKPFALAMRLFANMTAGHIALLALIGMIFTLSQRFPAWAAAPVPVAMALFIMVLELFVAFLQAFIFMLLTAVFIGLIRTSHH
jgi:F-type H+-transporting ATPase subunit a